MENFVPSLLAKKLKEKGFKKECLCHYIGDDLVYNIESPITNNQLWFCHNKYDNIWHRDNIDAPTIPQVLEWLRKEKKISIEVGIHCSLKWVCGVYEFSSDGIADFTQYNNNGIDDTVYILYDSYELATLAGIEYVIDNLI